MEPPETEHPFDRLVDIVADLRSEEGCPWDRKQTMESMVDSLREESEEVVEAVEAGDMENLEEELGDYILPAVFYAQMAREQDQFDIEDVLEGICEKLIDRHPHVFGQADAETAEEAVEQFQNAKDAE